MSLNPGIYPALVTPFDPKGRLDFPSVARLMARSEAHGCAGVVLAGTTGEGPSLSAVEKRDLIRESVSLRGGLSVVLGLATNSLDEAVWLCKRAAEFECSAVLAMPPTFFREAEHEASIQWMLALMDASPVPVLAYNFPKYSGVAFTPEDLSRFAEKTMFAGVKDSSGDPNNLLPYRAAVATHHLLFTGNEMLLPEARQEGWNGSISGNANSLADWIVHLWSDPLEAAETKREVLRPVAELIRQEPLGPTHKAILTELGVISSAAPRLPQVACNRDHLQAVMQMMERQFGTRR